MGPVDYIHQCTVPLEDYCDFVRLVGGKLKELNNAK